MLPLQVGWEWDGVLRKGPVYASDTELNRLLFMGVFAPSQEPRICRVTLTNLSHIRRMALELETGAVNVPAATLRNLKVYLSPAGERARQALLFDWPERGAGVEISFDDGLTWSRFIGSGTPCGDELAPESWLTVPAAAIDSSATDGILEPFDPRNRARIVLRFTPPSAYDAYGSYDFTLGVDYDVI